MLYKQNIIYQPKTLKFKTLTHKANLLHNTPQLLKEGVGEDYATISLKQACLSEIIEIQTPKT